ncbi:MAG: tRNA (adenosine(37)-N6)-threonylcarbamoyltransferase complex dimerization subunit type 1 TsaB [Ruminococcaceae bacterium]|nr:tRNA (adenosine(37)-N6)-threonylcarbamoyltransferase complex dimerization subunit type 1 TsaB [Oscillospiraceae bacterium]
MLIFGVDTCSAAATSAIFDGEKLVAQTVINHKKTHSQKIMPQIDNLFSISELSVSDIDVFAAAVGPGSFTGVRIGVATIKGMAQALSKPCVPVSTLEALSFPFSFFNGVVCPILDARRGQVYNAVFENGKRLCPDRALALSDLLEELSGKNVIFLGDGIFPYREEILSVMPDAKFSPKVTAMNLAGCVCEVAYEKYMKGEAVTANELVPSYVRLSQAEQSAANGDI